jgi:hypothetical protein
VPGRRRPRSRPSVRRRRAPGSPPNGVRGGQPRGVPGRPPSGVPRSRRGVQPEGAPGRVPNGPGAVADPRPVATRAPRPVRGARLFSLPRLFSLHGPPRFPTFQHFVPHRRCSTAIISRSRPLGCACSSRVARGSRTVSRCWAPP